MSKKEVEAILTKVEAKRRDEAREVFAFVQENVPEYEPYAIRGMIGFGSFHYKGRTCEGDWFKIGVGINKSSFSVYSCAVNGKGMLPEQYGDKLGKVTVGKSCIRFTKWGDVNKPALRKLLRESVKSKFAFE